MKPIGDKKQIKNVEVTLIDLSDEEKHPVVAIKAKHGSYEYEHRVTFGAVDQPIMGPIASADIQAKIDAERHRVAKIVATRAAVLDALSQIK